MFVVLMCPPFSLTLMEGLRVSMFLCCNIVCVSVFVSINVFMCEWFYVICGFLCIYVRVRVVLFVCV